jgi:hypothetical protein
MFRFIRTASREKKPPAYPELDQLLHVYFGEDFDLWGHTVEELVGCYKRDSPVSDHQILRDEIARFRQAHPNDLDEAFLDAYKNFFNPPPWNHTTDSFLTELDHLLREPNAPPAAP